MSAAEARAEVEVTGASPPAVAPPAGSPAGGAGDASAGGELALPVDDRDDGAGGSDVNGGNGQRGGRFGSLVGRFSNKKKSRAGSGEEDIEEGRNPRERKAFVNTAVTAEVSPEEKRRRWELILSVRSMEYVGSESSIDSFFSVCMRPENPRRQRNHVKMLAEYTPAFILTKNERKSLDIPIILYNRKCFNLSYKDLNRHVIKIDMWKVSNFTFNSYHGVGVRSLADVASRDPNMSIRIKMKLTSKDLAEKKKKRIPISDVALFECTINLEEMFDFRLVCENWNFELRRDHPDYARRSLEQKCLTFVVPRSNQSEASAPRNCSLQRVPWSPKGQQLFFWGIIGQPFQFRGTRTALSNQYFVIVVHSANPVLGNQRPFGSIGKALMGLTSVLDISVFKGQAKALDMQEKCFNIGQLTGSVKCIMCSVGETMAEEIPGGRPEQRKSSSNVTHLNSKEKFLVVSVKKCEGLAAADGDKGTSDPYLRVCWDNMVQKSPILKMTIRPVFNHSFYFPVRLFNNRIMERRYQTTALVYEYRSKGDISIQVWDDDDTSADSLGFVTLPLQQILASKTWEKRTLRGPAKSDNAEENEFAPAAKKQWYEEEKRVRVYDGYGSELIGCSLPNQTTALIHFEAYFWPDYPGDLTLPTEQSELQSGEVWKEKDKAWHKEQLEFMKSYAAPFPDSIGAKKHKEDITARNESLRRFHATALHPQTRELIPLPAFLVRIITPEEYSSPSMLLHWINCITFKNTAKQARTGLIPNDGWKDPQYLLFRRMGPAQDHAILLCSVLLGSKKDAYVVKGTIWVQDDDTGTVQAGAASANLQVSGMQKKKPPRLVEHVWVMTREEQGFVTFWEPCTREMYHLPARWNPKKKKKRKVKHGRPAAGAGAGAAADAGAGADGGGEDEEEAQEDEEALALAEQSAAMEWTDVVPDVAITSAEDVEALPTIGRMPRAKQKAVARKNGKGASRQEMEKKLAQQREKLPIAPNPATLREGVEGTLVDWLPYDSIDVVFNMDNLWANHQNHHPACIHFDFDDADRDGHVAWAPLIKSEEERQECSWKYINSDVLVDPTLKPEKLIVIQYEMETEMEENMRLYRGKRGYDTFFDSREDLRAQIDDFLSIQEQLRRLDIDTCPIYAKAPEERSAAEKYVIDWLKFGKCSEPYNRYGTPFSVDIGGPEQQSYESQQQRDWEKLLADVEQFRSKEDLFPTRKGKVFKGVPMHFSTADKEQIRSYLMQTSAYLEMLDDTREGLLFTTSCKIFGLLGGVQSTWLYFGLQSPQEDKDDK